MSLCELRFMSGVLGLQTSAYAILPDNATGPLPVFYLLHGLSDDYTIWLRRTRIEVYAAAYPMIVVMPHGYRGFYTNNDHGPAYADYIAKDVVGMIDRTFHTRASRAGRAIGGLSMGGYGALRLGLGYPELFCSVNSHSGAPMRGSGKKPPEWLPHGDTVFGKSPAGSDHDLIALARKVKKAGNLPAIRIDCGKKDFLIEENRKYHDALLKLKIPHEYEEFSGEHTWDYWDEHIREALQFHAKNLEIVK